VAALVVSVVWANLQIGRNRYRMRETERRFRSNAMVLEHYRQNAGTYPAPSFIGSAVGLTEILSTYGTLFQPEDGWGRPLVYSCSVDGDQYSMMSFGSNARSEFVGTLYRSEDRGIENSAVDVVIRTGEWVSYDWAQGDPGGRIMPDDRFLEALAQVQHK